MQSQTVTLIGEYNNNEAQLASMQNSESHMQNIDSQVVHARNEVSRQQGLLGKTQDDAKYMEKRIHRNEHPRLLHYLVWNREAKVERLKGERQDMQASIDDLSQKIATDSAQLSSLQKQQQQAHTAVDTKHHLQARNRTIVDQVVNSQPETPTLQQARLALQQQSQLLTVETHLQHAVAQCSQFVQRGLSQFQEAECLYRQAHNVNDRAKQVNRAEAREARRERLDEAFGDERDADRAEWNRENLEAQERRLQAERDDLINRAHGVVVQAYNTISSAFNSFPLEARSRYPQLCVQIGQVAFPRVEGANFTNALIADTFFGTMGAALNDFTSECKIQKNMRIVEQCASMTSQQLGLIEAMRTAVQTNVQQMQASVRTMEQNIAIERTNIFNAVRAAASAA